MIDQSTLDRCAAIGAEFGAKRLILFGSSAESPETARDIDLVCEGVEGWDIFRLGAKLEEALAIGVDLVPLRPNDRFSQYVAAKGRVIYESQ